VAETGVKGKRQKKMERKLKKRIDALVADVDSDQLEDSEDDN
jgi:adenylyl- and sulfurtransferase ThiI